MFSFASKTCGGPDSCAFGAMWTEWPLNLRWFHRPMERMKQRSPGVVWKADQGSVSSFVLSTFLTWLSAMPCTILWPAVIYFIDEKIKEIQKGECTCSRHTGFNPCLALGSFNWPCPQGWCSEPVSQKLREAQCSEDEWIVTISIIVIRIFLFLKKFTTKRIKMTHM